MIPEVEICMPFAELLDIEKEIERQKKEEARLQKELASDLLHFLSVRIFIL